MRISILTRGLVVLLGMSGLASAQFKYWNVDSLSQAPATLSATGLYVNLAQNKNMIAAAVPFEVNSALWSDGSAKKRWVLLKPGTKIGFKAMDDYFDYPDSAVFIKQFAIDTIPGDTTSRRIWETRLLILKKTALDPEQPAKLSDMWYGFSYRWRKNGREADLVPPLENLQDTVGWYPAGRGTARAFKKWVYPSQEGCFKCHGKPKPGVQARSVLGFFAAQLNRPSLANPAVNQIEELFTKQVFSGTKPTTAQYNDTSVVPRWYGMESTDPKATPERKSRAYIAANCSGCHGKRGLEAGIVMVPDLTYDYHTGKPAMVFEYAFSSRQFNLFDVEPVSFDPDSLRYMAPSLITPGYPQKSVLYFRQISRNTKSPVDPDPLVREDAFRDIDEQMPPLATFEVNTAAVAVIKTWIESMPKTGDTVNYPISVRKTNHARALAPMLRNGKVFLPAGLAADGRVGVVGIDGTFRELRSLGQGAFALPDGLPKGMYVLKVGAKRFKLPVF